MNFVTGDEKKRLIQNTCKMTATLCIYFLRYKPGCSSIFTLQGSEVEQSVFIVTCAVVIRRWYCSVATCSLILK